MLRRSRAFSRPTAALWALPVALVLVACGSEEDSPAASSVATSGTGGSAGAGGAGGATLPTAIGDHAFGAFEPWATPIQDYEAIGEMVLPGDYARAINELMPFGERLWIGYGDGTYNMGEHTPIEFRSFPSEVDPTATAAPVEATGQGAPQTTPYQSGEEQIDRYRLCDGDLYQAGVDAIDADELDTQAKTDPKEIQGNAYRLVGDTWNKYRSIRGGEHVQDLGAWNGALYGVGSGADFRTEFEAGQIFRYLWRSDDKAASFTTVERIMHPMPGTGDTRWVHLLPTTDKLFLFGYESDFQSGAASIRNSSYDGSAVTPLDAADPLSKVFPFGTAALPDGSGVVYGVDIGVDPPRYAAFHVAGDGAATKLDAFAGKRVTDVGVYPDTGEVLYFALAGDEYPGEMAPASYDATVLVAPLAAPGELKEVGAYSSAVAPVSLAFWRHALFLGTDDARVLKASLAQ